MFVSVLLREVPGRSVKVETWALAIKFWLLHEAQFMKRVVLFTAVFLLLAGLIGGLAYVQFVFKPELIKGFIAKAAPPPASVAVVRARAETWAPRISAIGTFRAVQGVEVAPQVGGAITAIRVDSGQDVQAGAPLFDIDTSVEQADLLNNEATLINAQLAYDRQRKLTQTGNTTKANVDSAQAARDSAAAAVQRVKALIAQKHIVAPFAGRLGIRKVDLGQYVSPGTGLITLQNLDPIFVDFPVPEQSLAVLKRGQTVKVKVDAFPGRIFRGKVQTIDARVDQNTRSVLVRALFPNKDHALRPGMFANVDVIAGKPMAVVTLPRTAISYSLYGDAVFVVVPAEPKGGGAQASPLAGDIPYKVERRFVRTGDTRNERVAISFGVKPGEEVVSEGQLKLQSGARVRVNRKAGLVPPPVLPKE
ncbi:Multidrug resistance protein MexA [Methylovirgula sp. HY1]|nr:Multidrug resistance protein MexA [Methylovirgula sp. HY1]